MFKFSTPAAIASWIISSVVAPIAIPSRLLVRRLCSCACSKLETIADSGAQPADPLRFA
jgi:hypothetical protein